MIVYFCKGEGLTSGLIKLATMSQFSHVAIQIGPSIYESTMEKGVIRSCFSDFADRYPEREMITIHNANEDSAETWLMRQVGKPYDYMALAALPLRKDLEEDAKWFCSELVAMALVKAGALKLLIKTNRITPRDLWYSYKMRWKSCQ